VAEGGFLKWTGHQVGIGVAWGVSMVGCLMVASVQPLEWIDLNHPVGPWVLMSGFALAIPAFVGLCAFVRCPRCRARVVWEAFSREAHHHGTSGLLAAVQCPRCGFSSVSEPERNATANRAGNVESVTSLQGPVEKIDGKLTISIPLDSGGNQFVQCTAGISDIDGDCLKVVVQEWLAGLLRIEEGDLVIIDNANGKFNIRPVNPRSIH